MIRKNLQYQHCSIALVSHARSRNQTPHPWSANSCAVEFSTPLIWPLLAMRAQFRGSE
jgi:hypothetical protein